MVRGSGWKTKQGTRLGGTPALLTSSKSGLGAAKNIQNGPSPISTYPPFVRWPDGFQVPEFEKTAAFGGGLRTTIVFPADPPPPSLCAGSAPRPKNCPVMVEFAAASPRSCARRNCQIYDAWRASAAIAKLGVTRLTQHLYLPADRTSAAISIGLAVALDRVPGSNLCQARARRRARSISPLLAQWTGHH